MVYCSFKDLTAKLAYRIGGKTKFENKTDADWKVISRYDICA